MRAAVVRRLDGPGAVALDDVDEPSGAHPRAGGRRVLVEVHAAGLSFIDVLQTRGAYQGGVDAPYICGSEVAGVVLEAPEDAWVRVGDRVGGVVWQGALAERAVAIEDFMIRLPDDMSYEQGASLFMNYATAWHAIDRARVVPGESVLVTGASGGVGTCLLDLSEAFGYSAVALVSTQLKEEVARSAGASHVIRSDGDWLAQVKALTNGHGVDVFVDMVGGEIFEDLLRSLRIGGRGVIVGFAGGSIPSVKMNRLLLRSLTLTGTTMTSMELEHPGTMLKIRLGLQELLDAGAIRPVVGKVFSLEHVQDALLDLQSRRATGKVVVRVRS